jgi:hypothetical protein
MGHKIAGCLLVKLFALHANHSVSSLRLGIWKGATPEEQRLSNELRASYSRLDSCCLVAPTVAPMDEATHHSKGTGPELTPCHTVADLSGCKSFNLHKGNGKQYNQDALGPASMHGHS